jgi:hypothetical protein
MGAAGLHPWWTNVRDAAPARAQINAAPSRMRTHDHDHEDEMNNRIDTDLLLAERSDQIAHLIDELRNAKALSDKLQTLLDSKTHQVEALHKELDTALKANELITEAAKAWQSRTEAAERERAAVTTLLIAHADGAFLVGDPSPEDLARHVVDKLATDGEPDMDTVPLEVLLDTVRTFLDDEQEITVLSGTDGVIVNMLDRKFFGLTSEVRDLLDHGAALRRNLFQL